MKRSILLLTIVLLLISSTLAAQTFIAVEGGGITYTMSYKDKETVHDIWVDSFSISDTEVTVGQWRKFTDATNYEFIWEGHYIGDISVLSPDKSCPIQLVQLIDVVNFCNWKSHEDGLEQVYHVFNDRILRIDEANGYRIPTPEEWDYAARGGYRSKNYRYSGSNDPNEVSWYGMDFEDGTRPVGSKSPNELSLYDMTGNVREWTWPEVGIPYTSDLVKEIVKIRGGSWVSSLEFLGLNIEGVAYPATWSNIGFRLARNAD